MEAKVTGNAQAIETDGEQIERSLGYWPDAGKINAEKVVSNQLWEALEKVKELN